jgi:hypothetical protein
MSKRERLIQTLNHQEPEKVVVDLGSSVVTSISAVALTKLRKELGLSDEPVKCHDPLQVIAQVDEEVRKALDVDVVAVASQYSAFGYKNENWKPWTLPNGVTIKVGEGFTTTTDESGDMSLYPCGDLSVPPSAKMPVNGYYFDNITRQGSIEQKDLNSKEDFKNDFQVMSDEVITYIKDETDNYYKNTDYGINIGNFMCGLGDVAALPGPGQKITKGIRSVEDWLMAHYLHPQYVKDIYEYQGEVALTNLKKIFDATGNKAQVVQLSGTDFGTQRAQMISNDLFREFYQPIYAKVNDWVHENTNWKVMYHTCGSIVGLLDDLADINVDILNPVQYTATGMDAEMLKNKYGDKFVFWGGGVDTQQILPFGTAKEAYDEAMRMLTIFAPDGGFVFCPVHNIQAITPVENILAVYQAVRDYNVGKRA